MEAEDLDSPRFWLAGDDVFLCKRIRHGKEYFVYSKPGKTRNTIPFCS